MIVRAVTFTDVVTLCATMRPEEIDQFQAAVSGQPDYDPLELAIDLWRQHDAVSVTIATDDDKPLVAGGWRLILPGVWQSWMIGTESAWETHWHGITRICRRMMDALFDQGARRLQTTALVSRTKACWWFEKGLHMRCEGVWRGYGVNGEDVVQYARLHPELKEDVDGHRWRVE